MVSVYSDSAIFRETMLIIFPLYTMSYLTGLCKVDDIAKKYDVHFLRKLMLDIGFYPFSYRALSTMGVSRVFPPKKKRYP